MKFFRSICIGLLLSAAAAAAEIKVVLPEKPTPEERAFVEAFKSAIVSSNVEALVQLDYSGPDSSEAVSGFSREFFRSMVCQECISIDLRRVDPKVETERKEGDNIVRENLPVLWLIVVGHPPPVNGGTSQTILRAGLSKGKIRMTNARVVQNNSDVKKP